MHYRNGRSASNDDPIVQLDFDTGRITAVGILKNAVPSYGDYCNGTIVPTQHPEACACLCDCLHVDDLAELIKQAGLDKRPAGK